MADKRCFVQFSHPGREHDRGSGSCWNPLYGPDGKERYHRRKFMQVSGKWIDENGARRRGEMYAWGEWEPESDVIRNLDRPNPLYPRYLWLPYWRRRNDYSDVHNTDPFVFGERFLYSNCGQGARNKAGLKRLGVGPVIAFGSGKEIDGERKWVLDTVFVVKDSIDYDPRDPRERLEGEASETFLNVTGEPLAAWGEGEHRKEPCGPGEGNLRLYRGATPDDPVDGMYSFFPATPAGGDSGFPRPLVRLPKYIDPRSFRTQKGHGRGLPPVPPDELRRLWDSLVAQVREAGLVLGVYAEAPPERR